MINLIQSNQVAWHEQWANIATILGMLGVVFLIVEYNANRNLRNIQLMHRCIDLFRKWFEKPNQEVDFTYLELLNEELFYFQKRLIQKKVVIEWIEGILDFIQVQGRGNVVLNNYLSQTDIETLPEWSNKQVFFARVQYFTRPNLERNIIIPAVNDSSHRKKKRELATQLYKHIKRYKY